MRQIQVNGGCGGNFGPDLSSLTDEERTALFARLDKRVEEAKVVRRRWEAEEPNATDFWHWWR